MKKLIPKVEQSIKVVKDYLWKNPQLVLASLLFLIGSVCLRTKFSVISGALFGAGASLLGAWINEQNNRRTTAEDEARREADARRYLAPELNRIIKRVLYIYDRANANFISASAENGVKPGDLQADFIPHMPVLYPNAPQFRDLSGDDATALISFYDSLHNLERLVKEWWQREGQLPVNIFLGIVTDAGKSITLAEDCIKRFGLEEIYPPEYEAWGTLSSHIERSKLSVKNSLNHHIARWQEKSEKSLR